MLSEQKLLEGQAAGFVSRSETAELEIGNSRFAIGVIMAMAFFVGTWGCICLINGIAQSQNIHELGRGVITALTGL